MKLRNGFVSNSSSSCFLVSNLWNDTQTLAAFIRENTQLVDQYNMEHKGTRHYTHKEVVECAEAEHLDFGPAEDKVVAFGEQYNALGDVCRWMTDGRSPNWKWQFLYTD
jgi:hypothetical protein